MSAIPRIETKLSIDLSKLSGISDRAENLTPVWLDEVQPLVTDFIQRQFATEGAYGGKKWAPLAPATVALRQRPGHGRGGIGRDTNRLWASLVKSGGSSASVGGLLVIGPQTYERGSSLPYAQWFAGGYTSKTRPVYTGQKWIFLRRAEPKKIPARPIFPDPLPAELVTNITDAVRRYIVGGAQ